MVTQRLRKLYTVRPILKHIKHFPFTLTSHDYLIRRQCDTHIYCWCPATAKVSLHGNTARADLVSGADRWWSSIQQIIADNLVFIRYGIVDRVRSGVAPMAIEILR